MTPPAPAQPQAPVTPQVVAEERTLVLPTSEWIDEVWLGEQRLAVLHVDRMRTPYIEEQNARSVTLRLTDWVGRLPFRLVGESGRVTTQEVVVYPSKLARDPITAFAALSRMVAELPELQSRLRFDGELPDALRDLDHLWAPALRPADLHDLAARAWRLWQVARRQPHPSGRFAERRVVGGQVPDRVDWNRTLDLWGRGDFPQHVALDLPSPSLPAALPALRRLWQTLEEAATSLPPGPERTDLLARLHHTAHLLPRPHSPEDPAAQRPTRPDPVTRQAERLTEEVRTLRTPAGGLPGGHVRMAELYEFWAQIRLARALGAVQGEFVRTGEGLYTGTLTSEDQAEDGAPAVRVSLNPRLTFGGVSSLWQTLQPDLLALSGPQALVAEVKYRPLDRLGSDQQREINDQLLKYMGLAHAHTGLILWPNGDGEAERLLIRDLPLGRSRFVRLRLHPLDPPEQLGRDLQALGLISPEERHEL